MTYILGSRSLDGVVLIADRKFTIDQGEQFVYDEKLYEVTKGVIIGFSGNRGAFEVFKTHLRVLMDENVGAETNSDRLLLLISDTMSKVSSKYRAYDEKFEALVAIANPIGKATLQHFYPDGKFEPINHVKAIGVGSPYGFLFLRKCWQGVRPMQDVAQLGYFIIKCIEKLKLNYTVGLASASPKILVHYPQVWFIPDASKETYQLADRPKILEKLEENVNTKLGELEKWLDALFPVDIPSELMHLVDEKQKRLFVSDP